jgi:hypothetical protein
MSTKSHAQTGGSEGDTLVRVARTIGSALGTIAAKINRTPKTGRRRRKPLRSRVAKRAKASPARKVRSKRGR